MNLDFCAGGEGHLLNAVEANEEFKVGNEGMTMSDGVPSLAAL